MISPVLVSTTKMVSTMLVSSGVSTIVGYAAKSSVPKVAPFTIRHIPAAVTVWKTFQKYAIPAGAAALAGMASEQAVKYADKKIDQTFDDVEKMNVWLNELVDKSKKNDKDSK